MEKYIKDRTKKRVCTIGFIFAASIMLDFFIEMHAPDKEKIGIQYLLIIYAIGLAVCYICLEFVIEKEDVEGYKIELEKSQEKIEKLEKENKDESRIIWQKYHELNQYRLDELLKNNLKLFVEKESSIFSAQVYEYTELVKSEQVQIKTKFLTGYVEEQENLNSILQNYYTLPKELYINYKKLSEISDLDIIFEYLSKIIKKIKEVTPETCTTEYSHALLLGNLVLERLELKNQIFLVKNQEMKESLESNLKKEGLLKGILLNEPYWFNSKTEGAKKDRKYITFPFTFNEKSVIIMFTGHKDVIVNESYLVELLTKFNSMFVK